MSFYQKHLFVCTNQKSDGKKCCQDANATAVFAYMKERIAALGLAGQGKIRVSKSGCLGRCAEGPWVVVYPEGSWHTYTSFDDVDRIIEKITSS